MSESEGISPAQPAEQEVVKVETSSEGVATVQEAATETVAKEEPVNVCDFCGPLKPGEPVYQCMLCMKNVCVRHLDGRLHSCYVAHG